MAWFLFLFVRGVPLQTGGAAESEVARANQQIAALLTELVKLG